MKTPRRICSKCRYAIQKAHRWHSVHHALTLFGFTLFRWTTVAHRDCAHPTEIHQRVKRLKGEVPLPFEELTVKHVQTDMSVRFEPKPLNLDGLPAEQNLGGDVYPTYGGIQRSAKPLTITEFDPFN